MTTEDEPMAKQKKSDEAAAQPAAATSEPDHRWVIYRGGHPLIRRYGVVLPLAVPTRVAREIATLLVASSDIEEGKPESPTSPPPPGSAATTARSG